MRVLVACEFSGVVREAFNSFHGVHAISCDLLPPEDGRVDFHHQGDVRDILKEKWDLMIAHPECTRLCNSGVHWLKRRNLWKEMEEAALFFKELYSADIPLIAIENPIPHHYAVDIIGKKYDQIIQPYNFGEDASKATCLWLKGLPKLTNTSYVSPRIVNGKKRWSNQTDSGQNKLPPSETRWMDRSRTYAGIAKAMAEQWIPFVQSRLGS